MRERELLQFLLEKHQKRTALKIFFHFSKLLNIYRENSLDYLYKIELASKKINQIDFQWKDRKVDFKVVKKPKYWLSALVDVLSPSRVWKGRGNVLYLIAYSSRGILGWIRFTAPVPTIRPRGDILPALRGNGRSKDNLQERRGLAINHFLWSNKSQAWGVFRKSRGLKTLYMAVFERTLYPTIKELWGRMPLGIETTVLYGTNSNVFRNLEPLKVFIGLTEGYSSMHLGEELFKAWKDKDKRAVIKNDLFVKGYYIITPYPDIHDVVYELAYCRKLPETITLLDRKTILSKLKPENGGLEDKEYILRYLEAERKALKLMKEPWEALEVLREFHGIA